MAHFTTDTQITKREIINFSNKISRNLSRPQTKFMADMIYGILHSSGMLLSGIADSLKEPIQKINVIERLS